MATYGYNVPSGHPAGKALNAYLTPNEIFGTIFNMIISQEVFSDNFKKHSPLVDRFRTDGTLYGDTKTYYATDCEKTYDWLNDQEAGNLLALNRPEAPRVQAVTIDQFRQSFITVDEYLSKRAWANEGAFAQFNALIRGKTAESKKIYDSRLIKTFVGTNESQTAGENIDIDLTLPAGVAGEAANRYRAQKIAQEIANLYDNLEDETRDYNDYGFLRSYDAGDFIIIWNSYYANKFTFVDLPTLFNGGNVKERLSGEKLQSRYFGAVNATATAGKADGTIRSLVERDFGNVHVWPGDAVPTGQTANANESYTVEKNIICKIIHKKAVVFMSAFQTSTSFFNSRSLTSNEYLTFGFSKPTALLAYPYITVKAANE